MKATAHIIELRNGDAAPSLATLLKAAGDPFRLNILRVMAQDSFSVSELCDIFSTRQSALSHHLKILIETGLLSRKKEGTATYYRRALPRGTLAPLRVVLPRGAAWARDFAARRAAARRGSPGPCRATRREARGRSARASFAEGAPCFTRAPSCKKMQTIKKMRVHRIAPAMVPEKVEKTLDGLQPRAKAANRVRARGSQGILH